LEALEAELSFELEAACGAGFDFVDEGLVLGVCCPKHSWFPNRTAAEYKAKVTKFVCFAVLIGVTLMPVEPTNRPEWS
jgi:hypothetical protein